MGEKSLKFMSRYKYIAFVILLFSVIAFVGCSTVEESNQGFVPEISATPEQSDHKQLENTAQMHIAIVEEVDAMNDEQEVLAVLYERCEAMVNKDIDTLDRLMDDDIILTHITGATQTKWEWLNCIENETMRYYDIEVVNPVVSVSGNSATLEYTSVLDARIYGSRGTWTLSGSAYLEKIDDVWVWIGSARPNNH